MDMYPELEYMLNCFLGYSIFLGIHMDLFDYADFAKSYKRCYKLIEKIEVKSKKREHEKFRV